MKTRPRAPTVTVIALCYNHERFLLACLNSIRAQTFQDFELIVTDDCSRDSSPELIRAWLAENYPEARFIHHEKNVGLCATLNEALSHARGEFISMIATDDTWESDKIERQMRSMLVQPDSVAVVYSDAMRIDECGVQLSTDFIENHRLGLEPPSGNIFAALADGNFIPAMATLIRRSTIEAVGGYDERLTYEDYDMWLRLAQRYQFAFCPGKLARYRIHTTSMVRALFDRPTAQHQYTVFLICEKWLSSGLLSAVQKTRWAEKLWQAAYALYVHGDSRALTCLWIAVMRTHNLRALLLAVVCSFGISRGLAKKLTFSSGDI